MPDPVDILAQGLSALTSYMYGRFVRSNVQRLTDAVGQLAQWIGGGLQGIAYTMQNEQEAVNACGPYAGQIKTGLPEAFGWIQATIDRVTFTILPNSLGYLEHNIYEGWIKPMGANIAFLRWRQDQLWQWSGQIAHWQTYYVNPWLQDYQNFRKQFYATDQPAISTLIGWLRKPETFGNYMAPIVAWPLAGYMNGKAQDKLRQAFAYMIVNTLAEESGAAWDAIERWLVSST